MSAPKEEATLTSERPGTKRTLKTQSLALRASGPPGPRTKRGKMKSRYNALKHGIFASVVLRGSVLREKRADYENLLQSFRESFQPEGGFEEFLVEKLAQLAWRKARAVRAEAAIVMKQTEFLRLDREARLKQASEGHLLEFARLAKGTAMFRDNPYLLEKSLQVLELLKNAITWRGFDSKTDEALLESLYGKSGGSEGLLLQYKLVSDRAKEAEKLPQAAQAIAEAKKEFLNLLDAEMRELNDQIRDVHAREGQELPLIEESLAIPKEEELDRLLHYEARLDGAFERTLQQLERLQRVRRGQPVPPPIAVNVST